MVEDEFLKCISVETLTIHIPEYFKHPDRINPEPLLPVKKSVKNIKREESA